MSIENFSISHSKPLKAVRRKSTRQISEGMLSTGYMLVEMVGVFLLGLTIAHFYTGTFLGNSDYYKLYITPLLLVPLLIALKFRNDNLYDPSILQRPSLGALEMLKGLAAVFTGTVILGFLAGIASDYSRVWFVSWGFGSVAYVFLMRSILDHCLRQLSNFEIPLSRIAIFGDAASAWQVKSSLERDGAGTEIVGIFSDTAASSVKRAVSGNMDDLIRLGQEIHIDRIVIAKEVAASGEISRIMNSLSILPSEVLLHPNFLGDKVNLSGLATVNRSRLIRVQQKPISEWGLLIKSVEDKIFAAIGLVALSPLMLLVAIGIKLDSRGPVFFRQERHGYNQRKIMVWKFRTMSVMENGSEFKQAVKNDARITRFGAFLRKTSIDELPQLYNVLRGEMSIVGPRPHPVALNSDFAQRLLSYENRHKVKPGITGWAQINGFRGPTARPEQMRKRIEYDLEYIENWSLWFDLKIILATPFLGLFNKNAF